MKRKDYLHDEARGKNIIASPIQTNGEPGALSRLIQFTENSFANTKAMLNFIENRGEGFAFDMKADEVMTQINETKVALIRFAKETQHEELLEKASHIPDFDYNEYDAIFNIKDYSKLSGGIVEQVASIPYRAKLSKLKELLTRTNSSLSAIILYLRAAG